MILSGAHVSYQRRDNDKLVALSRISYLAEGGHEWIQRVRERPLNGKAKRIRRWKW